MNHHPTLSPPSAPIFFDSATIVDLLLPFAMPLTCRREEELQLQEAEALHLYYVRQGRIEVSTMIQQTRIIVALIGADNFFGEIGYFDGGIRVRDLRALEDSELLVLDQAAMHRFQRQSPEAYGTVLTFLAKRICTKFRRIVEEQEPLSSYAASLAVGKRIYENSRPVPSQILQTPFWQVVAKVAEEFKAELFNISHRLQQAPQELIAAPLRSQCLTLLDQFHDQLLALPTTSGSGEEWEYAWGYIYKEIFPYFMRSRFAERIYYKPKGYAGDYLMMEMIYNNQPAGDGKVGLLIDDWLLQARGARAVRGRRQLLRAELAALTQPWAERPEPIRIMNLACGSNRELFDFLSNCDYSHKIEALCVDIDTEALAYTNAEVNVHPHGATVRLLNENVVKWALGRARQDLPPQDLIYSVGLTDYLDRRLFLALLSRCHAQLKIGGVLLIGNFAPNPDRIFMDHILHWHLIYRDETELREIFAASPFGSQVEILAEAEGINLFVKAYKR